MFNIELHLYLYQLEQEERQRRLTALLQRQLIGKTSVKRLRWPYFMAGWLGNQLVTWGMKLQRVSLSPGLR